MVTLEQATQPPFQPPKKTIWYGIGEVVKNQLPSRHAERILTAFDNTVVPHLSSEQKLWIASHAEGVYRAAYLTGAAITTSEIFLVATMGAKIIKRFEKVLKHARKTPTSTRPLSEINIAAPVFFSTLTPAVVSEMMADPKWKNTPFRTHPDEKILLDLQELQNMPETQTPLQRNLRKEGIRDQLKARARKDNAESKSAAIRLARSLDPNMNWQHPEIAAEIASKPPIKRNNELTIPLTQMLDQGMNIRDKKSITTAIAPLEKALAEGNLIYATSLARNILTTADIHAASSIKNTPRRSWYELQDLAAHWVHDLDAAGLTMLKRKMIKKDLLPPPETFTKPTLLDRIEKHMHDAAEKRSSVRLTEGFIKRRAEKIATLEQARDTGAASERKRTALDASFTPGMPSRYFSLDQQARVLIDAAITNRNNPEIATLIQKLKEKGAYMTTSDRKTRIPESTLLQMFDAAKKYVLPSKLNRVQTSRLYDIADRWLNVADADGLSALYGKI